MMKTTVPTPGTNKLTERLLAQGVKLDDPSTWPEGVWACEANNFGYSREWRFTPTWESPCGLLIHNHGDMWGETWVEGEFKCAENDNPLFRCPLPGKPCPHRLKLPPGINCQFHRTDREWSEAESVERIQSERDHAARRLWEEDFNKYPGWDGRCYNLKIIDMPDGSVQRQVQYRLYNCIQVGCKSTQCVCRCGAQRDIRPSNIFYDMYIERRYTEGLLQYSEKKVTKGLKVFNKPIARTDAELALKFWQHDPNSVQVPHEMHKLNAAEQNMHGLSKEIFFVRHHQYWNGHTGVEMTIEIRNIRIGKNDQRDMLQDLKDVQDGIEVEHQSDKDKAAKAKKTESRFQYKVKKLAKIYANELDRGQTCGVVSMMLQDEKPELQQAVKEQALRILEKRRAKRDKEAAKTGQISLFDIEGGQYGSE